MTVEANSFLFSASCRSARKCADHEMEFVLPEPAECWIRYFCPGPSASTAYVVSIPQQDSAERDLQQAGAHLRRAGGRRLRGIALKRRAENDRPARPCRRERAGDRRQRQRSDWRGGRGREKIWRTTLRPWPMHLASRCRAKSKRNGLVPRAGGTGVRLHQVRGGRWRGSQGQQERPEARRQLGRDACLEERGSGPRPDCPRDIGGDRVGRCGTAHFRRMEHRSGNTACLIFVVPVAACPELPKCPLLKFSRQYTCFVV